MQLDRGQEFSWSRALVALGLVFIFFLAGFALLWLVPAKRAPTTFGVQFTRAHAEWLGLDWRAAYIAILDDLGAKELRLGAYWNEVQPERERFAWQSLDWMLDRAEERGASVVLAVGQRLPRWPECHVPEWVAALDDMEREAALSTYITEVVERYREHPAIREWQIENEPLLALFGECPDPSLLLLEREVALVRSLDPDRQILITDSGELSFWMRTASVGDVLGTTLYRIVWNPFVGYVNYNFIIPPAFYRLKAWLAGKRVENMIVAELQAEPWIPQGDIIDTSLDEQRESMNANLLSANIVVARATGFSRVYLWGAEYWYWLQERHGDASLWNAARGVFADY
jgi:hypothetical protein